VVENTYYVTHPNLGRSAVVHAPSTEKARTTFLDWLERNNHISRAERQRWRRNMVAERLEYPSEVGSDVELWYGYEETRLPREMDGLVEDYQWRDLTQEYERPDVVDVPTRFEEPEVTGIPVSFEGPEVLEEKIQPSQPQPESRKLSPIAREALKGFM
jgi:hypothetical protein